MDVVQGFVIAFHHKPASIKVVMKFLDAEHNPKHFSFNWCIILLTIHEGFACELYRLPILNKGSTDTILRIVTLKSYRLLPVIISQ